MGESKKYMWVGGDRLPFWNLGVILPAVVFTVGSGSRQLHHANGESSIWEFGSYELLVLSVQCREC